MAIGVRTVGGGETASPPIYRFSEIPKRRKTNQLTVSWHSEEYVATRAAD